MRIRSPSVFLLLWGFLWTNTRADLDLSDDLDIYGSGSGEVPVITVKSSVLGQTNNVTGSTTNYQNGGNPVRPMFDEPWREGKPIVKQSKGFMESKEVLSGVIAGGVVGLALAVLVAGILIYKWQKKDEAEYIQGQQQRDLDYHKDANGMHKGEETTVLV